MRVDLEATLRLEVPDGDDPDTYVYRVMEQIQLLAAAEPTCVGMSVEWEPV